MVVNAKCRINSVNVKDFNKSDGSTGKVYSYELLGLADNRILFCSSFSDLGLSKDAVGEAKIDISWSSNRKTYNLILVDFD